jgi:predicted CoA-binding protein
MAELSSDPDLRRALADAHTIAVLGAHHERSRAAFYVPEYLFTHRYRVLGVNPALAGMTLWSGPVRASLADVREPVDIVDVFRRPELLGAHLEDLLAMARRPKLVWLQQGIRNESFAKALGAAGVDVVQDRCTLAEHARLLG